ncbi:MAG: ABC transporter ATP-binding protein [Planctomycetes bacterium]|nr:ABC transporter ATP-binding protein [Planctomycetota bacterium]
MSTKQVSHDALVQAVAITKSYRIGRREIQVLRGVDMAVYPEEIVALVGQSGAGKSTLLHILGLLDPPTSGEIRYANQPVTRLTAARQAAMRHRHVGFVFQFYHLIPELTALQNVCLGSMMHESVFGWMSRRRVVRERASELLAQMGLGDRLQNRPSQLSGGERQRVAIARALIAEPSLILADEPTGNLDTETARGILDLIWSINETSKIAFLIVTHNERVAQMSNRIIRLRDGAIVEE